MNRARLVRENKPFAVWDLLVYAVIAALLVVLFLVFVVFDVFGTDSARGIRVQVNDEIVYTYVFGDGGTVAQGWEDRVEERTDGSLLLVRITTDDGWNEIAVDEEGQTAVMRDADCSLRKDRHARDRRRRKRDHMYSSRPEGAAACRRGYFCTFCRLNSVENLSTKAMILTIQNFANISFEKSYPQKNVRSAKKCRIRQKNPLLKGKRSKKLSTVLFFVWRTVFIAEKPLTNTLESRIIAW